MDFTFLQNLEGEGLWLPQRAEFHGSVRRACKRDEYLIVLDPRKTSIKYSVVAGFDSEIRDRWDEVMGERIVKKGEHTPPTLSQIAEDLRSSHLPPPGGESYSSRSKYNTYSFLDDPFRGNNLHELEWRIQAIEGALRASGYRPGVETVETALKVKLEPIVEEITPPTNWRVEYTILGTVHPEPGTLIVQQV